jgi:toxin-antitoxin system PIN domain toxin
MSRVALLDVNVLVALFYPDHIHHEAAHIWFSANRSRGWATCPITENGLVRILSNITYTQGRHESAESVRNRLNTFCVSSNHSFWPSHLSIRDEQRFKLSGLSHGKITDVYLLAIAVDQGGRFVTFDRRIPLTAAVGAEPDQLEVILVPAN